MRWFTKNISWLVALAVLAIMVLYYIIITPKAPSDRQPDIEKELDITTPSDQSTKPLPFLK